LYTESYGNSYAESDTCRQPLTDSAIELCPSSKYEKKRDTPKEEERRERERRGGEKSERERRRREEREKREPQERKREDIFKQPAGRVHCFYGT
jgi:hypothetical protein